MSYSLEVKKELANIQAEKCCEKAELYGIIRYKATLKLTQAGLGVEIITTHNIVARRIVYLFKKIYDLSLEIATIKREKLDYKTRYVLSLYDEAIRLLQDLKILNPDYSINEQLNYSIIKKDCCKAAMIRGLFLVQGSINNPEAGNYHLEIILENEYDIKYIQDILATVNIFPKYIHRTKGYVLYLKKSEQIGDFLNFIGAVNNLFAFEDLRIKKDYSNYVNRIINCDMANVQKALNSATTQLDNIKYLTEHQGLVKLTQRLTDAIVLRTTYPEYSLADLSDVSEETVGRYISKSGLSHCFKDIELLCIEIKGEDKKS